MGETGGMISPEHAFLSVNLLNQISYMLPKYSDGTGIGWTFPFQKREIGKKKEMTGPKI